MESKRTYSEEEVTDILNHYAFILKVGHSRVFSRPSENLDELFEAINRMDAIPIDFRRNEFYASTCRNIHSTYDDLKYVKDNKIDVNRSSVG